MTCVDREALALKVKRHLMPNVDPDGTISVEDAERWFLKLLEEAPTIGVAPKSEPNLDKSMGYLIEYTLEILHEKDRLTKQYDKLKQDNATLALIIKNKDEEVRKLQETVSLLKRQYAELYNLSRRLLGGQV